MYVCVHITIKERGGGDRWRSILQWTFSFVCWDSEWVVETSAGRNSQRIGSTSPSAVCASLCLAWKHPRPRRKNPEDCHGRSSLESCRDESESMMNTPSRRSGIISKASWLLFLPELEYQFPFFSLSKKGKRRRRRRKKRKRRRRRRILPRRPWNALPSSHSFLRDRLMWSKWW